MSARGFVHLYYGDGKGKTTAAVGLCVRACGAGLRTAFCAFLKRGTSGELRSLRALGVRVIEGAEMSGFYHEKTERERVLLRDAAASALEAAFSAPADLLVLDEAADAAALGLFPLERLLELIEARPPGQEIVITGHEAPPALARVCGYRTEFCARAHPHANGIAARRGIEY